jgi:signal transduction histidine kinase
MRALWVRISLLISSLLFAGILATAVLGFVFRGDPGAGAAAPGQGDVATVTSFTLRLAGVVTFVSIIGVAVGVLVSRTISAPITQLARAAQRIGRGDLHTRVAIGGSQELIELAHAFNTMAGDLQRAETLRANLMADVSHELRTPLTALEGNLRAALDRVYALDEAEIANLYSQTRHLIRLVNDLRELALADAHQLPLDKQPTNLGTLVEETLQVFAPLIEERCT